MVALVLTDEELQGLRRFRASTTSGHVTRGTPWPMPGSVSRVAPGISTAGR